MIPERSFFLPKPEVCTPFAMSYLISHSILCKHYTLSRQCSELFRDSKNARDSKIGIWFPLTFWWHHSGEKLWQDLHTEKSFRNLIQSNQNQIVFTIFRLIWIQTDFRLDPNQSEDSIYNLIKIIKLGKDFSEYKTAWDDYSQLKLFYLDRSRALTH